MAESVSKEIVKRLALFLKEQMPELEQVLEDWPEPNVELAYPTLSIFTGAPEHRPFPPWILSSVDVGEFKILSKYVVGDYEWKMQLDMWCASKPERHELYEKFYKAFNSQFLSGSTEVMGISLPLTGYHNIIARYELLSYNFDSDNEAAAQRKEWRTKMVVLGHCKAILERENFRIVESQIDVASEFGSDILIPE